MPKLIGLSMVGCAYVGGQRISGWASGRLDNGKTVYVPESECVGFNGAVEYIRNKGVDVAEYVERLDKWVKTGE